MGGEGLTRCIDPFEWQGQGRRRGMREIGRDGWLSIWICVLRSFSLELVDDDDVAVWCQG